MPIPIGSKAPDFTLKQKTESGFVDHTLSNNFGKRKTVLLFFPAAFTGVCTEELCDASAGLAGSGELDAAVYGISTDQPFAQEAWAKVNRITIPILSDHQHAVCRAYDAELPDFIGLGPISARASFVIDMDGTIIYSEQTPTPGDMPNFEAIKAALTA